MEGSGDGGARCNREGESEKTERETDDTLMILTFRKRKCTWKKQRWIEQTKAGVWCFLVGVITFCKVFKSVTAKILNGQVLSIKYILQVLAIPEISRTQGLIVFFISQ